MQYVDVKIHDNVATLLMDRPANRNALNPQLLADLSTAFSDVHQEKRVQAVVLTGGGDHFCSGLDLKMLGEISDLPDSESLPEWFSAWRQLGELLEQMLRFPKPVVAAVDGAAVGSGLALTLACDLVMSSKRASYTAVAVRRGLVGGATAALLSFRLGAAVAARMVLTGEPIDADEAYRIGLCGKPVESQQIWVAAADLAKQCTDAPREAVQASKRFLNESVGEALLSQLSAGAADSATACTTESAGEGIRSFLERREPRWP
ncbi:MAG: enoyl-CoA hydratase/isomerase family protein [Rubripirellula sp.]